MPLARYSLDANILSYILEGNPVVASRLAAVASTSEIVLCPMAAYEVWRGLKKAGLAKKLEAFSAFVSTCTWLEFTRGIWSDAAEGWAELKRRGVSVEDADLLIGYHAKHFSAVLVTHNVRHFKELGLVIEDWLES